MIKMSLLSMTLALATTSAAALADDASDLAARGHYLAIAGDCAACHTAEHGDPFAGGKAIATPLGQIFSTNITPSTSAGIGDYTFADFDRALRHGVRRDGSNLYPAMPYTAYAKISDEDMKALYAYFHGAVMPVDKKPDHQTALPFPFNLRFSMAGWNLLFARETPDAPDASQSPEWNRGRYLSEALGHCQTCHTPRNLLMAEEASKGMSGASLGQWYAPNITSDRARGIGAWSAAQIAEYLKNGHSSVGSQAGGPMLEAINMSFSKLSDPDLNAIATYISSLPAVISEGHDKTSATGRPVTNDLSLMSGSADAGQQIYADNCATCHQSTGAGGRGLPALVANAALTRPVADNAVMAVLDGLSPPQGHDMPAFADKLDDREVADLTNFLFRQFGDPSIQTTEQQVKILRAGGAPSNLIQLAQIGMVIAAVILFAVIAGNSILIARRRRRARSRQPFAS